MINDLCKVIYYDIPEIVKVRKHNCDISEFQKFLKKHKTLNNAQISKLLNIPKTEVEHWFRTDKYFSFPNDKIWFKLKDILKIESNQYDNFIIEWIEIDSVFEQSNRVYDYNGIAPTLTSTNSDLRIIIY